MNDGDMPRELSALVVPLRGLLETTGDLFRPYRLVDGDGVAVGPVSAFFAELAACGRPATTQRSYGMDLLRWFRFLWTVGVAWDQATRVEARDFCCWLQAAVKPARPHWRYPAGSVPGSGVAPVLQRVNAVTGKPSRGDRYEAATVAHCESVLRCFYDFHLEAGTGPMLNPFPLSRQRGPGRAQAHHNPMEPFTGQRSGRYRPKVVTRAPRRIPDDRFDALFAQLGSHRDRALVAFWVSTGARASELLGATVADADPGQQLITVIRKGTRALQGWLVTFHRHDVVDVAGALEVLRGVALGVRGVQGGQGLAFADLDGVEQPGYLGDLVGGGRNLDLRDGDALAV